MSEIPNNITFNLEYRSTADDAWYTSAVILQHQNHLLRVKFKEFPETEYDEVFSVSDFSTSDDVGGFRRRFRAEAVPVEDNECTKVVEGMTVCAAYTDDGNYRYFDAIVDAVYYKEHTDEKCVCNYLLVWKHGPGKNNISAKKLEDMCIIMTGAVDPTVGKFIKLVKEKLKGPLFGLVRSPRVHFCPKNQVQLELLICHRSLAVQGNILMLDFVKGGRTPIWAVSDSQETSITAQAYVFPSLTIQTYARGAIVSDNISNLKRICDFISNPNQLIVSLSGRPWVIAEDTLRTRSFNLNSWSLQPRFENIYTGSELKVVRLGTQEYMRAKALKDLFMEFRNHLNGLARRLDMEEKKRQPSIAN